jgi:TrmH family RNA methyltransferase
MLHYTKYHLVWIATTSPDRSLVFYVVNYYSVNLKEPFTLVIGNENRGPNDIWRKSAYKQIKIPILGSTESLNASVATGIILYDAVRQRLCK